MTPLIDVVFLLQIFFLCTLGFVMPEALLPTELPRTSGQQATTVERVPQDLESIRIDLAGAGDTFQIRLNRRQLANVAELSAALQALADIDRSTPVILGIASEVPLGELVSVYDAILAVGFPNINFATPKQG